MFAFRSVARLAATQQRTFSTEVAGGVKAVVVGAAGGIGQPLSTLLKLSEHIDHLALYDVVNTPGVAADLSHISTPAKVTGHTGPEEMSEALKGAKVVVIPAGVPRKPGMTRDDLFNTNASIVKGIAEQVAEHCPDAFLCVISNPVNSTVPIMAETLKQAGKYDPRKLFGVTTLDVCRANTFLAEKLDTSPYLVNATVVGGHAGTTILPIISQIEGAEKFSTEEKAALMKRIQFGGDEVVQAKDGAGSATLSMAYAGAMFTDRLLSASLGKADPVVECAFVESPVCADQGVDFFSTPITLGPEGVKEISDLPPMDDMEKENFNNMIGDLKAQIQKGKDFVNK